MPPKGPFGGVSAARALARSKSRMTTAFSFGSRVLDEVDRGLRQFRRRHLFLSDKLRQTKRVAFGKQVNKVGGGGRHVGMRPVRVSSLANDRFCFRSDPPSLCRRS